ncbi:unnamed protein product [Blumeria hordei]|uniref:histone acetyltransferase n=1 Tax=Blumeria hordei TaxID=2867405 RepID=A0A383UI41_BLUHO|nr:unnamed protein product [Blumeria hordei]
MLPDMNQPSLPSALVQQLINALPKDLSLTIYHLSTSTNKVPSIYPEPPWQQLDRTSRECHFLAASINFPTDEEKTKINEVLVYAIEIYVYSTPRDNTFFVSKVDSTGYLSLLKLSPDIPSPLRTLTFTILHYLVDTLRKPRTKSIISLFARAQDQYLFPGSVENKLKHVLDDHTIQPWNSVRGYLLVPGLDPHETQAFIPKNLSKAWEIGHPLVQISRFQGPVPPRCLIPHFPDDPKARYIDELDEEIPKGNGSNDQWKSIHSVDQFWEMMAYRQECSAGRLVGFIWIVFQPDSNCPATGVKGCHNSVPLEDGVIGNCSDIREKSQPSCYDLKDSNFMISNPSSKKINHPNDKKKRKISNIEDQTLIGQCKQRKVEGKRLTGRITPRNPLAKSKNCAIKYIEARALCPSESKIYGQVAVDDSDYKRLVDHLLNLDFSNIERAVSSSKRWINEVRYAARPETEAAWGQRFTGTKEIQVPFVATKTCVSTLNDALVRKKPKNKA